MNMYKTKARVLSTKKMLSVHFIPPLQSSYKLLKSYSKGVIFLEPGLILLKAKKCCIQTAGKPRDKETSVGRNYVKDR